MTMARSEEEIAKAIAESDAWMDAVEPERLSTDAVNDRKDLRQIGVAMLAIEAAEQSLVAAVAQAKAGGRSWTDIANVLGVSRQAARQRFGAHVQIAQERFDPSPVVDIRSEAETFHKTFYKVVIGAKPRQSSDAHGSSAGWKGLEALYERYLSERPQDSKTEWIGFLLPYRRPDFWQQPEASSQSDAPSPSEEKTPSWDDIVWHELT
jgi:hypothetical protein